MKEFNKDLIKKANVMFANGWDASRVAEKLQIAAEEAVIYEAKRLIDKGLCTQEVERFTGVTVRFELVFKEQSPDDCWKHEYWYKVKYNDQYEEDWFITQ